MKKTVGVLLMILVITGSFYSIQVNAQIHTPDGDICKRNYSIYKGFYDNKESDSFFDSMTIIIKKKTITEHLKPGRISTDVWLRYVVHKQ